MKMLQACSSNVRPAVAGRQHLTQIRRARHCEFGPPAARQSSSAGAVTAPRDRAAEEWAVVQQAIAGDASAQEHLFARHTDRLYRTAFNVLRNKEDAEDALQDGLCKAYVKLNSFQGRSSFSTWLTRIVINSALMTRRRKSAHPEASLDEILDNQPERFQGVAIDARPNPEKICAAIETNALFAYRVGQLSPALQVAFRLQAMNGLSITQSSRALGIAPSAFKSRICRARRKLACALQQDRR